METQTQSNQNITIFFVGSGIEGRITDYESLQKYEIFDWKTQRLLWIGYQKNVSNVKCHLSCLPKDVIKYIITFCSIYHKNNPQSGVERVTKDTKLQDIVDKYSDKQRNYVKSFTELFLTVRVWCPWRCIVLLCITLDGKIHVMSGLLENLNV